MSHLVHIEIFHDYSFRNVIKFYVLKLGTKKLTYWQKPLFYSDLIKKIKKQVTILLTSKQKSSDTFFNYLMKTSSELVEI